MQPVERFPQREARKATVLAKCEFFAAAQVWPPHHTIDPTGWLSNFRAGERAHAVSLLNAFMFYSEPMVDAMYRSAAQSLSVEVTSGASSLAQAKAQWRGFLARLRVTYVEGERPNPTDSGYIFARKARQVLQLDEKQILTPVEAVAAVQMDPDVVVLFVDDFIGSGNQMAETWRRAYDSPRGGKASFQRLSSSGSGRFFYAPLIAVAQGLERLARDCPGLHLGPAHVLDAGYTLTSPECILWPDSLKSTAVEFLAETSDRAGIVGNYPYGWKGFGGLALALAFWHGIPDATIPLIFWEEGGWIPLMRRT